MSKNIQTHNAKIDLIKKFLNYANITDASYAMLESVFEKAIKDESGNEIEKELDGLTLKATTINENNQTFLTTYARAIEARFMQDSKNPQGKKIDNKITNVSKEIDQNQDKNGIHNDTGKLIKMYPKELTDRTIKFTNRFKLLKHQENTDSGFSATLFEDTEDNKQKIFAIRGTEFPSGFSNDVLDSDANLALSSLPSNQYIDMIKFYTQCIVDKHIAESTPLIITGHSLGGALAQLLTLSLATTESANNVKEVYTFNSPGAKNLRIDEDTLGRVYEIDSTILNAKDKERALFKKIRGYEYGEKDNLLRDTTLIGYDNHLFNAIYKYFTNNENLKEHSILVRTLTTTNIKPITYMATTSSITYTYKIFDINQTFINCLEILKANNRLKQPLACQDSIHHIESDDDSNPDNNQWQDELIQNLGTDIDGKHYYINLGAFSGSHYILPTIHALQRVLMLLNSGNIDNLLEYNKIKDLKDESMFLRTTRERKNAERLLHTQPSSLYNLYY
ncbi:hypothetical protein HPMG_01105 [Helicobacter pullorum MIT 98-5489]|uniref:Fungal lipase-type domain-containing protein n=1 Tax=Helicobacter pullorum MIT 98-5489 TaxID=537972 RepID=C5F054_9HELI|nr:Mbeg1-like protein [Helicobacter pullorum]EEQ63648.1 hypothetical protein HPMG_01105 [Helicobacter pullorum MIT 98-5489]